MTGASAVSICLLADRPELIEPVGRMRWREWGRAPGPADPAFWVEVTRREAGRHGLPFTLVAIDADGAAVGAVGLGEFDHEDLRNHSPWVMGMVVDPVCRGRRIGRELLSKLEARAARLRHRQLWVSTERASGFYQRCGWQLVGPVKVPEGSTFVLTRAI